MEISVFSDTKDSIFSKRVDDRSPCETCDRVVSSRSKKPRRRSKTFRMKSRVSRRDGAVEFGFIIMTQGTGLACVGQHKVGEDGRSAGESAMQ